MKFFVILASVVLGISAATHQELWSEFKQIHGRSYLNIKEEQLRFSVFQQNLRTIEEHNEQYERGEKTYYLGVTKFADMTVDEFTSMLGYNKQSKPELELEDTILFESPNVAAAAEVNWVNKGVVTEVKDQGKCGSCWSFSATGALESAYALKHGSLISLSEQNLLDCSSKYGNEACDGGLMEYAYKYVKDYGIETEKDYPYTAHLGSCVYSSTKKTKVGVTNYAKIAKKNEVALASAVASVGPVAVAVNAEKWQHYAGGIFDDSSCKQTIDHGVLAVGYGTQGSTDYWLIKNSWGKNWGENGYIRLVRNKSNQCGIVNDATYPILN